MRRLESKLIKIGSDPKATAKAVNLRYAIDSEKGFHREKSGGQFRYTDGNHKKINNKTILERIKKLVIPPAWENVWISPYENGHLQVTGTDTKGRKQYRYHASWSKIRNQSKFFRLRQFAEAIPCIRKQVEKDLELKGLPYQKIVALVVRLLELTHIRIGNEAYKRLYGSFGLTTLRDKHVSFSNGNLDFVFVGKKGVHHKISLKSKKLINLIKKCKDIPGQELFQYYDNEGNRHSVGSADINHYLKEITHDGFTAKDFRVWAGSIYALGEFREAGVPKNQAECKHKIVEVLDSVASKLGNTRTVCKKYYIHPTVIAAYEKGTLWNYKSGKCTNKLSPEEKILVNLLQKETIAEVIG
jgi:DNA topoisomerase-1